MALQLIKDTAMNAVKSCLQIRGAENHLVKIKDSLEDIHKFLEIAERSPIKDPELMELLEKLKDAAYDTQDLLEEYEIADRRRSKEAANSMPVRDTMTNKVRKVVTSVLLPPVVSLIILRTKLNEVSERLEAIKAEAHAFQLEGKVTNLQIEFKKQRETHSFVRISQVIERDEETEEIVNWLLSRSRRPLVSAIAIVGMGGLGKTRLAQSIFNDDAVANHFQPKMWICVSDNLEPDNFDIKRLGNKILERATPDRRNFSDLEELQNRLREALGWNRFLLVLDDVWNEEPENWYRLGDLLLCGERGSRIVVTTRSLKVASNEQNSAIHFESFVRRWLLVSVLSKSI